MSKDQVWGVTVIANEEDIIGYTLSHMFAIGVEKIMIMDNMSVDRTPAILKETLLRHPDRLIIFYDDEKAFYQGKKLTALANAAHRAGATWIIPFDADELVYLYNKNPDVCDAIRNFKDGDVIGTPLFNHYCTSKDEESDNPFKRIVWRHPEPNPLDKTIVRWNPDFTIDEGNHRILKGLQPIPGKPAGIGRRHFSARDEDRWMSKSIQAGRALNLATDLNPTTGLHVRQYTETYEKHGVMALREHYHRYFFFENPEGIMIHDPAPYAGDL